MALCKLLLAAAMLGSTYGAATSNNARVLDLPPRYHNGTISVEHLSVAGNLDGFKMLTPAAKKSTDFWYFDVVSKSTNQTLNIVFFNSGDFAQYPHPLAVQVSGVYPNGTDFYFKAMADAGVHLTNGPRGITGDWKGIGSFSGTSLDKPDGEYTINIDSEDMGIYGRISFKAVSDSLILFLTVVQLRETDVED